MTHAIILSDLHSHIKPGIIYAKANDIVEIITNYGGVLIVELGVNRFPVNTILTRPIATDHIPVFNRLVSEHAVYKSAYSKNKKVDTLIKINGIKEKIDSFIFKYDTEYKK